MPKTADSNNRTHKIKLAKDLRDTEYGRVSYLTPEQHEAALKAYPDYVRNFEQEQRGKRYSWPSWNRKPKNISDYLLEKNVEIISSKYSSSIAQLFLAELRGEQRKEMYVNNEVVMFSFIALNEFLGQNELDVYKDYLDKYWDRDYENLQKLKINTYKHTDSLAGSMSTMKALQLNPSYTKVVKATIEGLTKDQVQYLTSNAVKSHSLYVPANSIEKLLKALIAGRSGSKTVNTTFIGNQLSLALAKTIVRAGKDGNFSYSSVLKHANSRIDHIRKYQIVNDPAGIDSNHVLATELAVISDFLEANAEEFTIIEISALIFSLSYKASVVRSGNFDDYIQFLTEIIETNTEADAVYIMKIISDTASKIESKVPTITQWKKAFKDGVLDDSISSEITLMMILGEDDKVFKTEEVRVFRHTFSNEEK